MSKDRLYADYELIKAGLEFRKSSFSADNGGCVEVAELPGGGMAVRDSKSPERPPLLYTAEEWTAFLLGVVAGEF